MTPCNQRRLRPENWEFDRRQIAELEAFVSDNFLNDAELAFQWAANKTIDGLYTEAYWVLPHK